MAPRKIKAISVPVTSQLYLQELFNRTELERQIAMNRIRTELGAPADMAYDPQTGVFVTPPTHPTDSEPDA